MLGLPGSAIPKIRSDPPPGLLSLSPQPAAQQTFHYWGWPISPRCWNITSFVPQCVYVSRIVLYTLSNKSNVLMPGTTRMALHVLTSQPLALPFLARRARLAWAAVRAELTTRSSGASVSGGVVAHAANAGSCTRRPLPLPVAATVTTSPSFARPRGPWPGPRAAAQNPASRAS